eukprot:1161136-Pelagomonas_calceolata.AAC.5
MKVVRGMGNIETLELVRIGDGLVGKPTKHEGYQIGGSMGTSEVAELEVWNQRRNIGSETQSTRGASELHFKG